MKNNIKEIRLEQGISQKELAKKLKISQQAVSYLENHDAILDKHKMKKIAKILNKEVVEIFPEIKELVS